MSDQTTTLLPACMSGGEQALLRSHLEKSKGVLEFGIGGSTGISAEYDLDFLIGIDSHPDWIAKCYQDPRIAALAAKDRVELNYVDIGPIKEWGIPVGTSHASSWPRYSLDVWPMLGGREPDFVFIDGRFRLSCALQSLMRLPNLKALGFHDFRDREYYKPVLEFTDILAQDAQLVILAPKPDMDLRKLGMMASQSLLDAR